MLRDVTMTIFSKNHLELLTLVQFTYSSSAIVIFETKKQKQKQQITSKFNFCWDNLDIVLVSNVMNKVTKVGNIDLLFGIT